MTSLRRYAAVLAVLAAPTLAAAQPVIVLDYTYDTNNFFGAAGSDQRIAMQTAATMLTSRLTDNLTAITPGGINSWTASFNNPATGSNVSLVNPTIAQNQIIVYVGGRELGGTTLGVAGPGSWGASGTTAFFNSIRRGSANSAADFAPWGGAVTFDSVGTNWNFSLTGPVAGTSDFLSVALHELGHLLGFGTSDAWTARRSGSVFTGPVSTSLFGGNVPLSGDLGHWAEGTSYLGQETAMDPTIFTGTRKLFTELDFAGLDDIGWDVTPIPEPATAGVVATVGLAGAWGVRQRVRRPSSAN